MSTTGDAVSETVTPVHAELGPPSIELRPLAASDWEAVHEWARLEEVTRYQAWGPNTAEQTKAFLRQAAESWAVEPQTWFIYAVLFAGAVIGSVELHLRGHGQGELGYGFNPAWWGRGLATAATARTLEIGFTEHRLHRIYATCDPRNTASKRLLERLGMTHEGRLRENLEIRDGWRDSDVYSVLDREWRAGTCG